MTVRDIYDHINAFAPFDQIWLKDNVGLLVGGSLHPVSAVMTALDITPGVVRQAREAGCELIVSHHPVIYYPIKGLAVDDPVYLLAQSGIAAICAHTNADFASGGINDCLADLLGLGGVEPLYPADGSLPSRVGGLREPMRAEKFCEFVKAKTGCGVLRYARADNAERVERVA
ncbi:MAG: Nif3-like dinuclear metal center hexameric protein, partial [Oscillospiraceae bacterium]|nr:Nif3-like dinuclear metal center hexameric protein [Oscillospiraceae bacterium]